MAVCTKSITNFYLLSLTLERNKMLMFCVCCILFRSKVVGKLFLIKFLLVKNLKVKVKI